jgi:hypothetical protein
VHSPAGNLLKTRVAKQLKSTAHQSQFGIVLITGAYRFGMNAWGSTVVIHCMRIRSEA